MPYVHPDDYADTFHNATAEQERDDDLGARIDRLGATALRLKADRDVLLKALRNLLGHCEIAAVMPEAAGKYYVMAMDAEPLANARAAISKATALEQSIAAINGEKGI